MKREQSNSALALFLTAAFTASASAQKAIDLSGEQIENIVRLSYPYVAMYNVNNKFALDDSSAILRRRLEQSLREHDSAGSYFSVNSKCKVALESLSCCVRATDRTNQTSCCMIVCALPQPMHRSKMDPYRSHPLAEPRTEHRPRPSGNACNPAYSVRPTSHQGR